MSSESWAAIETEIDSIVSRSVAEPFDQSTVANAYELVAFARTGCSVPTVSKGYWSTICFSWETPLLEVEVFGDRFEVYRFYDRRTDIRHIMHAPGDPFPLQLATELPRCDATLQEPA